MTEFAKLIQVKKYAGSFQMLVDGQEFPWYIGTLLKVDLERDGTPGVTVTLIAERVEVVDSLNSVLHYGSGEDEA